MATCAPCDAGDQFKIQPLPGVPVQRFVTPLVRVNAQVQEMQPGMKIPAAFVAPPTQLALTAAAFNSWFTGLSSADQNSVRATLGITP